LKQKSATQFEKQQSTKQKSGKQAQKTSKFQLKQTQKQATRMSSQKLAIPQKKQARIRGKNARLATLNQTILISRVVNRSFMCALSRFAWCHKGLFMPNDSLHAVLILQ